MTSTLQLSFFQDAMEKWMDRPSLISRHMTLSYKQLHHQVSTAAGRLRDAGFRSGDMVALLAPNTPEYIILLFALWSIRAVTVLLNTRWPALVKKKNLLNLNISRIFTDDTELDQSLKSFSYFLMKEFAPADLKIMKTPEEEKILYNSERDASVVFTSGSSGASKAVLHSLGNHYYSALGSNQNIPVKPGDRWLLSLPLYHVGGLAIPFRVFLGGGTVVLMDDDLSIEKAIKDLAVTHISLVPTQLMRLLRNTANLYHLQQMKAVLLGGAAIPANLIKQATSENISIFTSYGSSEMDSQITTTAQGDTPDDLNTAGRVLPYRELIIDEKSEILVRGKTLFRGYLEKGRINPARDGNGWFHSGDMGLLNKNGYLKLLGRRDNMFISGGENIYPEEIEQAVCRLDGVQDAIVVAVKHPEYGERPVAFVKTTGSSELILNNLKEHLIKILPSFKIPDQFLPWPTGYDAGGMKVNRQNFQKMAAQIIISGVL